MSMTSDPNTVAYTNMAMEQLKAQLAYQQAQLAYQQERMKLIDVPMLQVDKENAAMQAATAAANATMQLSGQQLQAMQAAGQIGTQDLGVANLGMGIGQLGLSQEGQRQGNLQNAAGAASQEAFNALNLAASLRGPENAFQQQATMEGMNNLGVSNGIGAIAGAYARPMFQAPQANPQAASLRGLAADIIGAGGSRGMLTPTQQAYNSALANTYAPSWTGLAQSYLGNLSQDRSTMQNQYGNVQGSLKNDAQALQPVWNAAKGQYNFAYPDDGSGQSTFDAAAKSLSTGANYSAPSGGSKTQASQPFGGSYTGSGGQTMSGYSPQTGYGGSGGSQQSGGGFPGASYMMPNAPSNPGYYAPGGQGYQASLDALPNLNQMNMRAWYRLPTDTQSFIDSAYNAKGYSTNDVNSMQKSLALPYQAPTYGSIR